MKFSSTRRNEWIGRLENELYDVLVIGGGITGAGIALDAVSRGMKVALIEMQDFAAGTSSRSTKLVHGGLRYLKQLQIKLVAEVGREREIVYENGPHVTTPEWMLLPFYKGGTFGPFMTSIGLLVYDRLAGVKRVERRKMLSRDEVIEKVPILKKDGLLGGGYYVEYRTDDARLTIEVLKKAVQLGATAVNYVKADQLVYDEEKVVGVQAVDQIDHRSFVVHARKIVNATGPWVDELRELDHSKRGKTLRLTKGVHIVFDQKRFPLQQSMYFDTPDGRMVFAIPRDGKTYVGTTDTDYNGDVAHPRMTVEDRDYLLKAIQSIFPNLNLTVQDIESSWAGLRPLIHEEGKAPSEISRKDEIFLSPSGLISIAGGKLTGYRKMAENVTNLLQRELEKVGLGPFKPCSTKQIPISGGDFGGSQNFATYIDQMTNKGIQLGLSEQVARELSRRYGTNVENIYERIKILKEHGSGKLPVHLAAMLEYSIEEEMAVKPVDFFIRRTGAMFFHIDWVLKWKDEIVKQMAQHLHYEEERYEQYVQELEEEIHFARNAI